MASLQIQKRRNPATGKVEPYFNIRWMDPILRKRRSTSLGFITAAEAEKRKRILEAHLLLQSHGGSSFPDADKPAAPTGPRPLMLGPPAKTLRDWLEEDYLPLYKLNHAKKSFKQECSGAAWLAELLGHQPLDAITPKMIDEYKLHRMTTKSKTTGAIPAPRTVNIELRVLKSSLTYARESGVLHREVPKVTYLSKAHRETRYLTPEQVTALLNAARPDPAAPKRDENTWLVLLMLANLGLRKGEALTREWSDIDFSGAGLVRITHKPQIEWFIKGGRRRKGRERTIPMTPVLHQELHRAWTERGQPQSGWLFPGGRHGKGTGPRKDCKKGLEYATRRAGLAFHVYPHMLRHAWASRLIMAGVDRKSIQEMGGWVDGRMLDEVYAHVTVEHKVSIMQAQGIG